jgi:hypothetical protein
MSQDSRDEQRTSGEWKNCPLTSDKTVEFFHHRFSDLGDEQKNLSTTETNPGKDI